MGETSTYFLATGALTGGAAMPALQAVAGAFVHIPGGEIHGFRIDSETARYLILTTPRHAQFYRAITSPSPLTAIDGALINKACQEYGIEFVGPLPD